MNRSLTILGLSAALGLSACSGNGMSPKGTTQQNLGTNVLQFSVGTANLYGDTDSGLVGMNVASTYRQGKGQFHPGDSAVAVDGVTISGPWVLNAPAGTGDATTGYATEATGPSPSEEGGASMTSTSQTGANLTTFGNAGGVFAYGIEPFNYGEGGTPFSYIPFAVPAYDPTSDANAFLPIGYQPAFPSTAGGPGNPGISEGLNVFAQIAPAAGTYSMTVTVPVKPAFTQSASATLTSTALLPPFTLQLPSLDSNNDGGASFPITLPAGVTEALVQITDFGPGGSSVSCNGSNSAPNSYTLFVNSSGTATLPPALGAGGTPSICTVSLNTAVNNNTPTNGDVFSVQLIGFDYPWYEASLTNSAGNPAPAITGANGQSDVTISSATSYQQVSGGGGGGQLSIKSFHVKRLLSKMHGHVTR